MHINLSPEIEQFLQEKVNAGYYGNASEVVRDAIRRMKDDEDKLVALRAAVQIGDEQLEKGLGVAYTAERLEHLTQQAFTNAKRGKKVSPDVLG